MGSGSRAASATSSSVGEGSAEFLDAFEMGLLGEQNQIGVNIAGVFGGPVKDGAVAFGNTEDTEGGDDGRNLGGGLGVNEFPANNAEKIIKSQKLVRLLFSGFPCFVAD